MRLTLLCFLLGCLNTEETYDCVMLYRVGPDVHARQVSVIASTEDNANDLATLEFLAEPPKDWVWVRPYCDVQ